MPGELHHPLQASEEADLESGLLLLLVECTASFSRDIFSLKISSPFFSWMEYLCLAKHVSLVISKALTFLFFPV